MQELNREELLKVTGGEGGDTGGTPDPADLDWSYCRATSYASYY
jgi:hypothetical protein